MLLEEETSVEIDYRYILNKDDPKVSGIVFDL